MQTNVLFTLQRIRMKINLNRSMLTIPVLISNIYFNMFCEILKIDKDKLPTVLYGLLIHTYLHIYIHPHTYVYTYTHIHVYKHITYFECGWTDGTQELIKCNNNNKKITVLKC